MADILANLITLYSSVYLILKRKSALQSKYKIDDSMPLDTSRRPSQHREVQNLPDKIAKVYGFRWLTKHMKVVCNFHLQARFPIRGYPLIMTIHVLFLMTVHCNKSYHRFTLLLPNERSDAIYLEGE